MICETSAGTATAASRVSDSTIGGFVLYTPKNCIATKPTTRTAAMILSSFFIIRPTPQCYYIPQKMLNPTIIAIPVFASMIAAEAWLSYRRETGEYADNKDTWNNIFLGFMSVA